MIKRLMLPGMGENTYIYFNKETKNAVLIDPGMVHERIESYIERNDLKIKAILLTHGHADHIMGVNVYRKTFNVDVYAHFEEQEILENSKYNYSKSLLGTAFEVKDCKFFSNDETLKFDELIIKTIHTPGHSKGSASFLIEGDLISGDLIFKSSVGRTDLYSSNFNDLQNSIKTKVYTLPDDTIIYPGHGLPTKVGFEKENNPFVRP